MHRNLFLFTGCQNFSNAHNLNMSAPLCGTRSLVLFGVTALLVVIAILTFTANLPYPNATIIYMAMQHRKTGTAA